MSRRLAHVEVGRQCAWIVLTADLQVLNVLASRSQKARPLRCSRELCPQVAILHASC